MELSASRTKQNPKAEPETGSDIESSESVDEFTDNQEIRDYQLVRDREQRLIKPPKRYVLQISLHLH